MARKKEVVQKSDSGSDEEEIRKKSKKVKVEKKVIQDSSDSEEEEESDEEEMVYNSFTNPTEHLRIETKFPLEFKLKLLEEIKNINKRKTSSYKVALRHFDWKQINIEGYTAEECKACLDEILKPICSIRTLDEMLKDYELHHQKYDLKMHPDAPKIPRNAVMRFIDDNREKFKKALCKEFPNKQIGLKEISSYGAKKFAELSEKEQEKYKVQYKSELKEYAEKKAELLKQCPELVKKRIKKPKELKEKVKGPKKERKRVELPYMTPFMIFRDELSKEGRDVSYHDAQALYKNMPDDEKMKYIQSLLLLDTHLEKQFSSQERKIMKNSNGMPSKPLTAYNLFIKDLCKDSVDKKEMLKTSSTLWKTLSVEQKRRYEEMHNKEVEAWQQKMEAWFKTLPIEQRAEHMAKHGFLSKVESTRKRKRVSEQPLITSFLTPEKVVESDNSKKRKTEELVTIKKEEPKEKAVVNIITSSPVKEKSTNAKVTNVSILSTTTDLETPTKKKKKAIELETASVESTPKRKKFKEVVATYGPYPSLTTAHYFMSQKYVGKPHKVAKAYSKLSKDEKKQLCEEMKKIKNGYFNKLKKYVQENAKDADKVRTFHENNRKEQEESVSWHTDYGTDRSDDSDDSDDSDSS